MAAASSSCMSVSDFFQPQISKSGIEWALFVAKHNLAFFSSEHDTSKIFTDLKIAKKFSCSCTKCAAIVKEALAPHFTSSVLKNMVHPFLIMIGESNDKIDKSCIFSEVSLS